MLYYTQKPHAGIEAKRKWLSKRLEEGHVFRKLDAKEKGKSGVCMLGAKKNRRLGFLTSPLQKSMALRKWI